MRKAQVNDPRSGGVTMPSAGPGERETTNCFHRLGFVYLYNGILWAGIA